MANTAESSDGTALERAKQHLEIFSVDFESLSEVERQKLLPYALLRDLVREHEDRISEMEGAIADLGKCVRKNWVAYLMEQSKVEELHNALQSLVETVSEVEDIEHDYFGCADPADCPLCTARTALDNCISKGDSLGTSDLLVALEKAVEWMTGPGIIGWLNRSGAIGDYGKIVIDAKAAIAKATKCGPVEAQQSMQLLPTLKTCLEMIRQDSRQTQKPLEGVMRDVYLVAFEAVRVAEEERAKTTDTSHPATLAIVLDGGLVQAVVTDNPAAFAGINTVIIDYDTDAPDVDDETLGLVVQEDSSTTPAYIRKTSIDEATVDLAQVMDFVTDEAYGSTQQRFAVCGDHPCKGCSDENAVDGRCVNEDKCLAWQHYNE